MRVAYTIRGTGVFFIMSTELQQLNVQTKVAMWAERISACRNSGLNVKSWCKENGVVFCQVKIPGFAKKFPWYCHGNSLVIAK